MLKTKKKEEKKISHITKLHFNCEEKFLIFFFFFTAVVCLKGGRIILHWPHWIAPTQCFNYQSKNISSFARVSEFPPLQEWVSEWEMFFNFGGNRNVKVERRKKKKEENIAKIQRRDNFWRGVGWLVCDCRGCE